MPPQTGWYYRLSEFFRNRYGERIYKAPVDAGFTCPNRDGTLSADGCIFCYNPGFSPPAYSRELCGPKNGVREQIIQYQKRLEEKNAYRKPGKIKKNTDRDTALPYDEMGNFLPRRKYIAYFQSYTNTYAPVSFLGRLYEEALSVPGVIGLSIATRPDCLGTGVIQLLSGLSENYHIWLELGLQTSHDRTLKIINRGHTYGQFKEAVNNITAPGIFTCVHVINGLPGETPDEMLETIQKISELPVHGIKFHQLQVIKNTRLEQMFAGGKIRLLEYGEYLSIVCDQLENLRKNIVVHRLLSEVYREELLLAPCWDVFRGTFSQDVERELKRRGTYQGFKLKPQASP